MKEPVRISTHNPCLLCPVRALLLVDPVDRTRNFKSEDGQSKTEHIHALPCPCFLRFYPPDLVNAVFALTPGILPIRPEMALTVGWGASSTTQITLTLLFL